MHIFDQLVTTESSYTATNLDEEKARNKFSLLSRISTIHPSFEWDSSIKTALYPLFRTARSHSILSEIQNLYLTTLNTRVESKESSKETTDDDEVIAYLNTHFAPYVEFVKTLKEFQRHKRKSSNTAFQSLLDNVVTRRKEKDIETFDVLCETFMKRHGLKNEKLANIGVTIYNETNDTGQLNYEAYLFMQCIGGELNDMTVKTVSCAFKNHNLGAAWNSMTRRLAMVVDIPGESYYTLEDAQGEPTRWGRVQTKQVDRGRVQTKQPYQGRTTQPTRRRTNRGGKRDTRKKKRR
jgi:hemerythrin